MAKTGRNEPCPCGSGMKYKHCCLNSTASKFTMEPKRPPFVQQDELLPVERLLLDGERDSEKGDCIEACSKWLEAWEIVKTYIEDGIRSIEELDKKLNWPVILFNWCQDFELELGNAGVSDNSFLRKRIYYCRDFVERLPDSSEGIILNMLRAEGEACFKLGEVEEGEAVFQRLTKSFPDSPWGYIGWGDVYFMFSTEANKDYERAAEKYHLALAVAKERLDRETVEDRLRNLKRSMKAER